MAAWDTAAGPGNDHYAKLAARLRYGRSPSLAEKVVNALTFQPDQSPGAGQWYIRTALQGFVPGGTSPQASASEHIFDRTVTTLLAW